MEQNENKEKGFILSKYKPTSSWSHVGWSIVYAFPIVGLIMLIINSLKSDNIGRRNHARSYFCVFLIITIILGACVLALYLSGKIDILIAYFEELITKISSYIQM